MINIQPNNEGFFGSYGGQFVGEELKKEFLGMYEWNLKNICALIILFNGFLY